MGRLGHLWKPSHVQDNGAEPEPVHEAGEGPGPDHNCQADTQGKGEVDWDLSVD